MLLLLFLAFAVANQCNDSPSDIVTLNTTGCTNIEWVLDSVLPFNVFDASAPTITIIDLTWNAAILLPATQFHMSYPVLTTLNLHGSFLTILNSGTFTSLSALLVLWIDGTSITALGSLANAPPLFTAVMAMIRLTLTNNPNILLDRLKYLLVNLDNLLTLEIRQCLVASPPLDMLAPVNKLTTLDISQNKMWFINDNLLSHTPLLEVFNSSNNPTLIPDYTPRLMFSYTSFLRVIDMDSNALVVLPIIPESVTYLSVASNSLSNLSGISGNLSYLDISANPIIFLSGLTASISVLMISISSGLDLSGFYILGKNTSVIIDSGACMNFPIPYPACTFIQDGVRLTAANITCPIPRVRDPSIPIAIIAGITVAVVVPLLITVLLICKL